MVYDKLVRDLVPRLYEKQGKTCLTEQLENEEYASYLIKALDSEIFDFKKAFEGEDDELAVKKMADLVQVLYAILDLIGVEHSSFEKIRLAEVQKLGGYDNHILLKEVND